MGQLSCKQPEAFIARTSILAPKSIPPAYYEPPLLKRKLLLDDAAAVVQRAWRIIRARKRFSLVMPMTPYEYLNLDELAETLEAKPLAKVTERKPVYVYQSGAFYSGYWKGGFRERKGLIIWPDGAFYEGEWRLGRMAGEGNFALPEGLEFVGAWAKYKQHSRQGPHKDGYTWLWFQCKLREMKLLESSEESRQAHFNRLFVKFGELVGEIQNILGNVAKALTRIHSKVTVLSDGSTYEGQLKGRMRHGLGRLSNSKGLIYEGMWEHDSRHGIGRAFSSDGGVYEGTFVHGLKEGFGTSTWPNSNRYIGMWLNGHMQGLGEFNWCSGRTYRGEWIGGHQAR